MTKERVPIAGDIKSKAKQLMEYAGWQEGRIADISIAKAYYADHGVPMMKTTQRFYRKYFGLCCEWYLEQKKLSWAADVPESGGCADCGQHLEPCNSAKLGGIL